MNPSAPANPTALSAEEIRGAAWTWVDKNWHKGVCIAGSDSSFIAREAFQAGVKFAIDAAATPPTKAASGS